MIIEIDIKELLKTYKFVFKSSCMCSGYETWTFKHPEGFAVTWRIKANRYQMSKGRAAFTERWENITTLPEKLKKHAPLQTQNV